jgi:hypothetical protein
MVLGSGAELSSQREDLPLPPTSPQSDQKKTGPRVSLTRGPTQKSNQRALLQAEIKGNSYPHLNGFAGLDAGGEL